DIFNQYLTYGYYITLTNLLPIIIIVFSLMAYHNARNLTRRTIPLIRRELDKQLTVMVLVHALISIFCLIPFSIMNILVILNVFWYDPLAQAKLLITGTTCSSFYIF